MYSTRAKHSREPELEDLISYVDKETALEVIHCFPRKLLSSIYIKEMSRLIREEGLEAMQSDLRENQRRNQIRTQKRRRNVSCVVLVMILMIAVYLCPKHLKIRAKSCSRINFNMAAMDVLQRITVKETVHSEHRARYVRKNIQLAYMDSNLRKKG